MMSFVNLQNVSLHYHPKNIFDSSLKRRLINSVKKNKDAPSESRLLIRSINDLSLSLNSGSQLGVIGRNGAGKSSLLKLIAGIYPPICGKVIVKGKVNSIMNASLGLRNDLSGYENIIHKGILLGQKIGEMKAKVKQIVEFSELDDRLYNQLHSYSSGMKMRLALGILLAIESDILLIDEVFGTLDVQFMNKYHDALLNNINQTAITVFVSHSFDIISNFCNDVLWLEKGSIKEFGEKKQVISNYLDSISTPPILSTI